MTETIEVHNMEQRSEEWFNVRLGRVTGSVMKDYFNVNGTLKSKSVLINHISKKVSELLLRKSNESSGDSYDMNRGREMEDVALSDFYAQGFESVGFVTNSNFTHFGVSPDCVRVKDNEIRAGVEVKCPSASVHTKYLIQRSIPNEYKGQMGLLFVLVPTIDYITFRTWNGDFDEHQEQLDIVITRDYWKDYISTLETSMIVLEELINESVGKLKGEL
jgi:hypothetical protein